MGQRSLPAKIAGSIPRLPNRGVILQSLFAHRSKHSGGHPAIHAETAIRCNPPQRVDFAGMQCFAAC